MGPAVPRVRGPAGGSNQAARAEARRRATTFPNQDAASRPLIFWPFHFPFGHYVILVANSLVFSSTLLFHGSVRVLELHSQSGNSKGPLVHSGARVQRREMEGITIL